MILTVDKMIILPYSSLCFQMCFCSHKIIVIITMVIMVERRMRYVMMMVRRNEMVVIGSDVEG